MIQKCWYLLHWVYHKKIISGCESINSVNLLYFIISGVEGHVEEKNVNKYLTFASTDKKKKY